MLHEFERSGRCVELDATACGWLAGQLDWLDHLERLADTPPGGHAIPPAE